MEEIKARIKAYALLIDSTITDNDFLDFVVAEVVDRALVAMNRDQLVTQYEEDLIDVTIDEEDYELPIPSQLERPLAIVVVMQLQQINNNKSISTGAVKSVSDNGQSVSYGDLTQSYFATQSDTNIFSGISELLQRHTIARTAENKVYRNKYENKRQF